MTRFKPTDKVKYDGEVLTIKVARKNFATKKILYRFEGKGNLEVEEKDLKKVALTKKEKEAEKKVETKKKLLKLAEERKTILIPYAEKLKEMDPVINLADMPEEAFISLGKLSKSDFEELVVKLEETLDEELSEEMQEQREKDLNEDAKENEKPEEIKMTRKSKKDKKK